MDERLTARQFQQAGGTEDFRVLGSGVSAWYAATSLGAGARLVRSLAEHPSRPQVDVDVRAQGVRCRIPLTPESGGLDGTHVALARTVAEVAASLGLAADPSRLQDVQLTFDTLEPAAVQPFWERALGYQMIGDEDLMDPLRRGPAIWFQDQDAPRPLRNRLHVDSVSAQEVARTAVDAAPSLGARSVADHDYYATVADAEGNEVDLLPLPEGADRWEGEATSDWRLVFSAIACYPVADAAQAAGLVEAAAALADEAGLALGIDVRPGMVVLDSGKDRWEMEDGWEDLAAQVQAAARGLGLVADVTAPRFVQVVVDAVDIEGVREFWRAVLGYELDPREGVTDVVDPLQLNMPVVVQDLDADDEDRRAQRNRIHLDVFLPEDQLEARLAAALAAGGTVVRDAGPIWWTVADPEGNEVDLTTAVGREEAWGD